MSLSIPQYIVDVADVSVAVDTRRLGARQLSAIKRMVRTGHLTYGGIAAEIAEAVRVRNKAPYIQYRSSCIYFDGFEQEFFDKTISPMLPVAASAALLHSRTLSDHDVKKLQEIIAGKALSLYRYGRSSIYGDLAIFLKPLLLKLPLTPLRYTIPHIINYPFGKEMPWQLCE